MCTPTETASLIALSLAWGPLRSVADLDARAMVACAVQSTDASESEAAILMRLGWTESRYAPKVGRCARGVTPGGFFQVVARDGAEYRQACSSADAQAALALARVRESRAACAHLPEPEQLAIYTRGSCASRSGRRLSRERHRP